MAVVQMQKVAILGHKSIKEDVLEILQTQGVLEVRDAKDAVRLDHIEVAYRKADVQFAIDVLKDAASKETAANAQKPATEETILRSVNHTDVRGIVEELRTLEEKDTTAHQELQTLQATITALTPWQELHEPLDSPYQSTMAVRLLGTLPATNLSTLQNTLENRLPKTLLEHVNTENDLAYISILVWKGDQKIFEETATSMGWTSVTLPHISATALAALEDAKVRTGILLREKAERTRQREQLSIELPKLVHIALFMQWLGEKQSVREAMSETASTFTLLGWMPKKLVGRLENILQKTSPALTILRVKADNDEEPPVLLHNRKWITPFQSVTSLYGLPRPNEWDPTAALSPFFILYFALCLTDAGYGLVLALIFGIVIWKKHITIEQSPLAWCLFMSGIMAFFVGILFGGWLGLAPQQIPASLSWLTKDGGTKYVGQVWNLSQQTGVEFLQYLSLVLGITHLMFGMFLSGAHKWIHGQKMRAFWEDFTSHLLIGSALFIFAAPENMAKTATYILYGAIALAIWGKGYGNPWFIRPFAGALGLMNLGISMISNGLSYLRILALGLVTGALAMAVNQVAVEMGKLFPIWLAIPVIITIFIVGHLVSIALNTLGSFIHSARLQFIEFFSQFFEGGGRMFSPFSRQSS